MKKQYIKPMMAVETVEIPILLVTESLQSSNDRDEMLRDEADFLSRPRGIFDGDDNTIWPFD